jgi:hypothetical protein
MAESTLTPHATYCVISTNFANILEKTYKKKFGKTKNVLGINTKSYGLFSVFYKWKEMQFNSTFLYFLVAFYK